MISRGSFAHNEHGHFRTLGICWVVYGIVRLVGAIWLISFSATATLMFGALLGRVRDPFTMMDLFHVIYTLVILVSLVCGVVGIIAGLALLAGKRSGRPLAVIAGFLSLSEIPFGIALGAYSLIVLLPLNDENPALLLEKPNSEWKGHPSPM